MAFELDADYIDVAERIRQFRAQYPEGSLQPWDFERPFTVSPNGSFVIVVAAAYRTPDDPRPGVGMAWEPVPGTTPYTKNSELMNAETSAWGRAIIAVGAADAKRIASAEEVRNRQAEALRTAAQRVEDGFPGATAEPAGHTPAPAGTEKATEKQTRAIYAILMSREVTEKKDQLDIVSGLAGVEVKDTRDLTKAQAGKIIDALNKPAEATGGYGHSEEPF